MYVRLGPRFVPGQIIETRSGPMFVPGRIIETSDPNGTARIAFLPGNIVETDQGPRFVAPDLTETHGGGQEFTVQSFGVTQEELELFDMLGPGNLDQISSEFANGEDGKLIFDKLGPHLDEVSYETVINSKVLRKLGEQGRRLTKNCPEFGIVGDGTSGQKLVCCDFLDAEFDETVKEIFTIVSKTSENKLHEKLNINTQSEFDVCSFNNSDSNGYDSQNDKLDSDEFGKRLRGVVQVLSNVCRVVEAHGLENKLTKCVDTTPKLSNDNKHNSDILVNILTQLLSQNPVEMTIGPKQILNVVKDHLLNSQTDDISLVRMHNMLTDSKLLNLVIRKSLIECKRISISQKLGLDLQTESPEEKSKNEILFYLFDNSPELAEAFAALSDFEDGFLKEILADFKTMIGATKEEILCVLRSRVLDRILHMDITQLDASKAKLIPQILQNLHEANRKDSVTSTSDDRQDSDSSQRCCSGKPILILKPDLEAVVPREATRDVLCGRTAYSVLDETGLRYFEPTKLRLEIQELNGTQYTNGGGKYDSLMNTDDNNSVLTDERSSLSSDHLSHTPSQKNVAEYIKNGKEINYKLNSARLEEKPMVSKDIINNSIKNNENKAIVSVETACIQNIVNNNHSVTHRDENFNMNKFDSLRYTPGFIKVLQKNLDLLVSRYVRFIIYIIYLYVYV